MTPLLLLPFLWLMIICSHKVLDFSTWFELDRTGSNRSYHGFATITQWSLQTRRSNDTKQIYKKKLRIRTRAQRPRKLTNRPTTAHCPYCSSNRAHNLSFSRTSKEWSVSRSNWPVFAMHRLPFGALLSLTRFLLFHYPPFFIILLFIHPLPLQRAWPYPRLPTGWPDWTRFAFPHLIRSAGASRLPNSTSIRHSDPLQRIILKYSPHLKTSHLTFTKQPLCRFTSFASDLWRSVQHFLA